MSGLDPLAAGRYRPGGAAGGVFLIDAGRGHRRLSVSSRRRDEVQGALSAGYIFGYRLALLVAGAGALYIADREGWAVAYLSMAVLICLCMLATLWADEPVHRSPRSSGAWTRRWSIR
jgi:MFS family permease